MKSLLIVTPLLTLLACVSTASGPPDTATGADPAAAHRPGGPDGVGARRTSAALWTATRREADSLRVWVSWEADLRRAPGVALLVAALAPGGSLTWQDTVRLQAAGDNCRTFTVSALRLQQADRLRLWELPLTDATTDVAVTGAALTRSYALADSAGHILTRAWLRGGELVRPVFFGLETPLTLLRYTADFQPALPPMAEGVAPPASPVLKVIETRVLGAADTFRIRTTGLYALRQGDTAPLDPLLVASGGFPSVRSAPELIQPLIYLTTREERQRLYDAADPKKATDRFWLDIAQGQQEVARALIRTYYGRVAEANRLFSGYKAGWMTDRGMLFIVLGPPPTVQPTPEGEDWVYKEVAEAGGTRFRFRRRPSTFAPDQYELRRDRGHEAVWYAATAQWRKGIPVTAVR